MKNKQSRKIYLSFEFEKDIGRHNTFIGQAKILCNFSLVDNSILEAIDDKLRWQKEAKKRINKSDLMLVLLGQDTHNAPGVKDEVTLAKQEKCPIIQLIPQKRDYENIGKKIPQILYKWKLINAVLENPKEYINNQKKVKTATPTSARL